MDYTIEARPTYTILLLVSAALLLIPTDSALGSWGGFLLFVVVGIVSWRQRRAPR